MEGSCKGGARRRLPVSLRKRHAKSPGTTDTKITAHLDDGESVIQAHGRALADHRQLEGQACSSYKKVDRGALAC